MKTQNVIIVLIGYFGFFGLLVGSLIQYKHFAICIEKDNVDYELIELKTGTCRGSCEYIAIIVISNEKFRLNIQKWEYQNAKNGEKLEIYYCESINKALTKTSITINRRVCLLSVFLIFFWTAMLKWVFIPYDKKNR